MPCRPCVNVEVRGKLREKYGIDGDKNMDCLFHCCLPVCAIAQEANEVQQKMMRHQEPSSYLENRK